MTGKQDWRTPPEFLSAVQRRFGVIGFDLAATTGHEVTGFRFRDRWSLGPHFSPGDDSLSRDWGALRVDPGNVAWLNPPFANIRPWARKCDEECRNLSRWTLMLVPASMGSHWWADHVLGKCIALGVTRMKFVGADAMYPKDLALCCYGFGVSGHGFWDWKAGNPGGEDE
jgi:hypothetical protein